MGSRQFRALGAILAAAALSGCQTCAPSPAPDAAADTSAGEGTNAGSGAGASTTQPTGNGESGHLVGTDVEVEVIEVTDEGPPAPTVLFTAGLKGYTEPCGCTIDLVLGGIDRVTGYVDALRALAPASVVLDVGNTLFEHPTLEELSRAQEIRKTEVIIAALQAMGTTATVPGRTDFANGVAFYRDAFADTGISLLGSNLTLADQQAAPLTVPYVVQPLGERTIAVIGALDPARFEDVPEVVIDDPEVAVEQAAREAIDQGADTVILLWQGDLPSARRYFGALTQVDFIAIGSEPRNTDETEAIGGAMSLEAYDQGRHVGRLKLVCGTETSGVPTWVNARVGSDEEAARLERVIAGLEEQIAGMGIAEGDPVPPIAQRLVTRMEGMRADLDAIRGNDAPVFPEDACAFLYRPIPMEPTVPALASVTDAMRAYNDDLRALNLASATPPEPAAEGMPHYVGMEACASCHSQAVETWHGTAHSLAWETLEERGKQFDRSCIGCHVTGYEEPGGSTLGHTTGLVDVQCEQCHGPGSMHAANPQLRGLPTGVFIERTEQTCIGCHNDEHSPRFDYDTYLPRLLGPGHGL